MLIFGIDGDGPTLVENLTKKVEHIRQQGAQPVREYERPIILVANKIDLRGGGKQKCWEGGRDLAKKLKIGFIETSALWGTNIGTAVGMAIELALTYTSVYGIEYPQDDRRLREYAGAAPR